jgi:hypothetical protein
MPSLAQCLRIRRSAHASLRRSTRVNLHQRTTSFCRFVHELCGESRPSGVINRLGQHSTSQALHVQLFNHYQPEHHNQRPGNLVREIRSLVAHMRVSALQLSNGFLPVITASLAAGNLALRSPHRGLGLFVVPRVFDLGSIRERSEGSQPHIKAGLLGRRRQRFRLTFYAEHRVPLSSLALECDGFDIAFDWPMQFDFDRPYTLQSQFAVIEHLAAVAVAGEGHAVISADRPESRVSWLLALPDASKERIEGLINAAQHVLTARVVGERQVAISPNLFQLISLIAIAQGFTGDAIGIAALLKGGIVEAAGFGQLAIERGNLRAGRVEPIFEILSQLSTLLILNVFSDRRLRNVTHRADVITSTPKRRKSGFQKREFFAQDARSEAFELRRDVRRGQRRIGLNKHMNVIRQDLKRMYRGSEFGGFFLQQLFQPFCYRATKDRLAVFRTPNEVVFEREDRASVPFVTSVNHLKYLNRPLDILHINNAGFEERIALREALRTMRNSPVGYKPTVPFRKTYG